MDSGTREVMVSDHPDVNVLIYQLVVTNKSLYITYAFARCQFLDTTPSEFQTEYSLVFLELLQHYEEEHIVIIIIRYGTFV